MTIVTTAVSSGPYTAVAQTTFDVSFQSAGDTQISVTLGGVTLNPADYTFTRQTDGTGVVVTDAPVTGEVMIWSEPSFQQSIEFQRFGAFYPDRINPGFDIAAIRDLYLRDTTLRSVRAPRGEALLELPAEASRVGKYLAFDAGGDPLPAAGTGNDAALRTDLATSGGSALVGFLQASGSARTLQAKLRDAASIKDFNPVADGVADDRAAFVSAMAALAADQPLIVPSGSYRIASSLTFTRRIIFLGGKLVIPTGVTVTLNGGVTAEPYKIFECTGTGAVVFDWAKTSEGYAEWWGALGDNGTDCYAALMAALLALQTTQLLPGDYHSSLTPRILLGHRTLRGVGCKWVGVVKTSTRLIVAGGSQAGLQIGPDAEPATINDFPQDIVVEDIYITRLLAPVIASAAVGVQVQYCLSAHVNRVKAAEHMIGFRFYGNVYLKVRDCESVRSVAGTGGGTDYWRGFWADGTADIGAAGGNASLYVEHCAASCNIAALQTGDSIGWYSNSKNSDTFLNELETANCNSGEIWLGLGVTGANYNNLDIISRHSVHDQFRNQGIFVGSFADGGSIEIVNPYLGPNASARAALWISAQKAAVRLAGGQFVMGGAPGCQPIILDVVNNVTLDGPNILECGSTYSGIGMSNANNCVIRPRFKNLDKTAAFAVALLNTCTANIVEPVIAGKANAFTKGIDVAGTADARNEYNLTGIDSACINGGSGNKLVRNAVQITATGLTGTNLVSGVVT